MLAGQCRPTQSDRRQLLLGMILAPKTVTNPIQWKVQASVDTLMQRVMSACAAGTALALETLKRALSLDNRSRDSLVSAALSVGLVQLLLQRLDWRQKQAGEATSEVHLQPSRAAYFPSVTCGSLAAVHAEPEQRGLGCLQCICNQA